jgi:hypothetical protein
MYEIASPKEVKKVKIVINFKIEPMRIDKKR